MLNKNLFYYLSFLMLVLIDSMTKQWVLDLNHDLSFGMFGIIYRENPGIIMGLFANIPVVVKTVYLCTIGISLFAFYIFMTSYFKFKTRRFYLGITFVIGGVLGNVIDRICYGSVIDFIAIGKMPVFNIADLFQVIGLILLILCWKSELDFHSPQDNKRELSLANEQFQKRFIAGFFVLFSCVSMIVFGFSFVFLKFTLEELGVSSSSSVDEYLRAYIVMFVSFIALISVLIYFVARITSHRIYGPLKAIERYLQDTLDKKSYPFKLRERDNFHQLEERLTEVNRRFNQND